MRTKTFVVLAIIALFGVSNLKAQVRPKWELGIKSGVNVSTSSSTSVYQPNYHYNPQVGFNAGAFVDYNFNDKWFLRSGAEIITKRESTYANLQNVQVGDGIFFSGYQASSRRQTFLQIPLTLGHRVSLSKKTALTFNLGGYANYAFSSKAEYLFNGSVDNNGLVERYDRLDKYKGSSVWGHNDYTIGILGGVGFEYNKFQFNVDVQDPLSRTRNFAFTVGYKF